MKKILLITFFLFPLCSFASTIPSFPMAFWGSVTIDGQPAPTGTIIKAYYGNNLAGQVVVNESGIYGYTESTKQKLIISEGVGEITFKLQSSAINNGNETASLVPVTYAAFTSGIALRRDLAFVTVNDTSSTVPPSGGGGGGGLSTYPTATTTISTKADINSDGKVDILDFNSLIVNWGKTGNNIASDLNSDGKVDIFDFNLLMINWSK